MEYLLPLAAIGLACSVIFVAALLRREMRVQAGQAIAFASALKGSSDKLGSHIGRVADRTERLEKVLLELVERADAAMSVSGVDLKAYQEAKRSAAVDQMRELLLKGDEVTAIHVWRNATGLGMREAIAMVDHLEREMSAAGPAQIVRAPGETPQWGPETRNGATRTN
jgi:ribosomal protein L7/L12